MEEADKDWMTIRMVGGSGLADLNPADFNH